MRWVLACVLGLAGCSPGGRVVASEMAPQPFCTRTLGVAECFANPEALTDRPTRVGDTPVRTHVACVPVWQNGGLSCQFSLSPSP